MHSHASVAGQRLAQAERIIQRLPLTDKLHLVRWLDEETGRFGWKGLMRVATKLRGAVRRQHLTRKQIEQIVERSRQAYHDRCRP